MKSIESNCPEGHRLLAWVSVILLCLIGRAAWAADKPVIPEINASVGSCLANFTVTDVDKKPVSAAKIEVSIRWGPLGVRKVELTVWTNADGKARVIGLPEKVKKPIIFHISRGELSRIALVDPVEKCHSSVDVVLGEK